MSRPNATPPEEEHGSCRQHSERGCYHGPLPARRANGLAGASSGSWGGGAGGGGRGGQVHRGLRRAGGDARCGGPDRKRSQWRAYGRRDADDLRNSYATDWGDELRPVAAPPGVAGCRPPVPCWPGRCLPAAWRARAGRRTAPIAAPNRPRRGWQGCREWRAWRSWHRCRSR
jgi:hypothetical protein